MILKGKVIDGIGVAEKWVKKIEKVFKEKLDIQLFYGTLNVKVNEPYVIIPDIVIKKEEFGGTQNVLVQRCKINNYDAFIVRAQKNAEKNGDHGLDILEVVADVKLRDKFNLKNDNIVEISTTIQSKINY